MLEIENLSKTYSGVRVVDDVSFSVPGGGFAVIVGTSGSGKTTLLRMINRLVEPESGRVLIDGKDTREVPAYELRRQIGYAIQGHGLFPHRTVAQNIATVPSLLGWDRQKIAARVDELLELFSLEPGEFRNRLPAELSGGQQQRVGVARALAGSPRLLLMDEPFGALDPIIRAKAQADLLAIQKRLQTTIVLVTHDMGEAIHLGNLIAVMDQGRLLQYAPPGDIVVHPATAFVGELLGSGQRSFRRLSLMGIADAIEPGEATGAPISTEATLRDALDETLWSGRDAIPVADAAGRITGRIRLDALRRLAEKPA
jgi:osmoprotectant transport system ATP-binding protein